jgi:hypothetical protein
MIPQCKARVSSCGFALALVLGLGVGCSSYKKPAVSSTSTTSATQLTQQVAEGATFKFAPPVGTQFTRTEKRRYEASLAGTPISRREEQELRWMVNVGKSGDQYIINQQLAHITMKHNDDTWLDADVQPKSLSAQLVVDRAGNLVDVRGLENSSAILRTLVTRKIDRLQEAALTPDGFKALVAMRWDALAGDIAGRPVAPGRSWTVQGRPKSPIVSRTFTVERLEVCDSKTCAKLREDIKLDPAMMTQIAGDLMSRRVKELGGNPSKINPEATMYTMSGTVVTEPDTMLIHDASLNENGRIVASAGGTGFEVVLNGMTQYTYEYPNKPVASAE